MNQQLSPQNIVSELNKFVIGQDNAKKAVAIALRNRWRRKQVEQPLRDEIIPHNILMVGPTGVGKTEIARRLAKLAEAPFIKIEATKFTEVGYIGRDVDSIIRDLLDVAVMMVQENMRKEVLELAEKEALLRLINFIAGENSSEETKNKFYQKFKNNELNNLEVEICIQDNSNNQVGIPMTDIGGMPGGQFGVFNLGELINKTIGNKKTKLIKTNIPDAYKLLLREESDKLINEEKKILQAIKIT